MKVVNRIKSNEDFALTIKTGKYFNAGIFHFALLPTDNNYLRVGISVSKKLGNAVIRNKIKRQVRAICDHNLDFEKSYDLVIIVKQKFLENTFQQNQELFCSYLSKEDIGVTK